MVFKKHCVIVLGTEVASASEALIRLDSDLSGSVPGSDSKAPTDAVVIHLEVPSQIPAQRGSKRINNPKYSKWFLIRH